MNKLGNATKEKSLSHINQTFLGYKGHILNLKKHPTDMSHIKEDHNKNYPLLYHKAMKTAHLRQIIEYYISPSLIQRKQMKQWAKAQSGKVIKRFGCEPCTVTYVVIDYETLIADLLPHCPPTTVRDFLVSYGTNV